jgi:hypothetical protein
MDYRFQYDRLFQPNGNPSNYFALNFKEAQQEQWSICRSLLSKSFTAVKTQEVLDQIQESLEGDIQDERHYRSGTSVKSTFTLSGYHIDLEDSTDADTLLFQLITNIDSDISLLTDAKLTFNVINGFSGNHALQLQYGLMKTMSTEGNDDAVPINNIFVLDKFTKRLIHDNSLSLSISDVTNVQEAIQTQVNDFNSSLFTEELVNEFVEKFPKKFCKKFIAMFERLPVNLRNFYYGTYILSTLLEAERSINLELKVRSFVSDKMEQFLESRNVIE